MAEDEEPTLTQKTKPKKGEPIEIPVPKREDIEDLLSRAARPLSETDESDDDGQRSEDH